MNKNFKISLGVFLVLSSYCVFAAEVSQEQIQRYSTYYSNGVQFLKDKQYAPAVIEFKKVLRFSPYDTTVQEAIASAYLEKAKNYKNTQKDNSKALIDFKNACFYAKYWKNGTQNQKLADIANTSEKEIAELERKQQIPQDEKSKLQRAKILKAQGELSAAGWEFQGLLGGQYKKDALENLGNIYKNLNNIATAMDYYKTALDYDPKNAQIHLLYGILLDGAQNYEASMEQYNLALQYGDKSPELLDILENKWRQSLVNNPNNAQSLINLGVIYQKQGNYEMAKAQYLKAASIDTKDDSALLNLASLFVEQKNYASAIDTYNRLLARKPGNVEYIQYKISALKELDRWDEILKLYETLIALNPNDETIKAQADDIALTHFSGEKLQNFLTVKAKNAPNSYEAQFNCALEFHKNKKYNSALEYYKKAQKLNPSKEETYLNIVQIYLEQKNYNSAAKICEEGLMMNPDNKKLIECNKELQGYMEGETYAAATKLYEQKKYKEAIDSYLKIKDKNNDVKMAIASCYWQMNDFQNANKYYTEILASNPSDKEALSNSAYAYYYMKNYDQAKTIANKILSIDKNNKDITTLLNDINTAQTSEFLQIAIEKYEQKKYSDSMVLLDKILKNDPDNEWGLYYKGLNYDELNNHKEAIKYYEALISKHPEFKEAYYSLAVDLDNLQKYSQAVVQYQNFINKTKEKNEMTEFAASRIKELKDYLDKLNATK